MSENENNTTNGDGPENPATPAPEHSVLVGTQPEKAPSLIDLLLKDIKPDKTDVMVGARNVLIKKQTDDAIAKLVPIMEASVALFNTSRSELRKLKENPDVKGSRNLEGGVLVPDGFSPAALKTIKEAEERFLKLIKTLEAALTTGDFSKMQELTKARGNTPAS